MNITPNTSRDDLEWAALEIGLGDTAEQINALALMTTQQIYDAIIAAILAADECGSC